MNTETKFTYNNEEWSHQYRDGKTYIYNSDGEGLLSLNGNCTTNQVECALHGFMEGFKRGFNNGIDKAQDSMRAAIGL